MNQPQNLSSSNNTTHRQQGSTVGVVAAVLSIAIGVVCIMVSILPLLAALLGFAGILADVGPGENREMGFQALWVGLPLLLLGGVFVIPPSFVFWGVFLNRKTKVRQAKVEKNRD